MIRAALSQDAPDKFIKITDEENKQSNEKQKNWASIGIASEEKMKNYNPDLEVKGE